MTKKYWLTTRRWVTGCSAFLAVALAGGYEHTGNADVALLSLLCALVALVTFTSVIE